MKSKKGFTLIELLVVIAIIGILAAIVLVSLRGAPNRAKDARIKAAMNQVRTQAELISAEEGSYGYTELCDGSTSLNTTSYDELDVLQSDIANQQGSISLVCHVQNPGLVTPQSSDTYCVSAELNTPDPDGNTVYFCIDSVGRVVSNASSTACTAMQVHCE
ncbi:MAG: type II secretion system protein [Patescibacteria group bacterium]|nr:type II secretion system protein [Patescibacteria group bacterium]